MIIFRGQLNKKKTNQSGESAGNGTEIKEFQTVIRDSKCSVSNQTSGPVSPNLPPTLFPLTEGGAGVGPGDGRHDDEAEALVLASLDLHIVRLQGGGHHCAAAASSAAAADAAGGAAAGADGVERVLAALRGAFALRQAGRLGAAVVGGRWRWRHVAFSFRHWRRKTRLKVSGMFVPS